MSSMVVWGLSFLHRDSEESDHVVCFVLMGMYYQGVQCSTISVVNFLVCFRLLFFDLLLLYVT